MDYVEATDRLTDGPTLDTLAGELGVSAGLVRQARMDPSLPGFRKPPAGWERAVAQLAYRRAEELAALAAELWATDESEAVTAALKKVARQLERGGG